jgi:hypothetical protein
MRLSKLSLVVLSVLFSSISLYAQTDSVKCNSQIQFHLVNGYSLSCLNLLSSSSGIRFKVDLGLNGSSGNSEHIQSYYNNGSNNSASEVQKFMEDRASSSQNLNLVVNYIWLSNITKEIRLYFGIGPLISFYRYNSENNQERNATSYYPASKSIYETTSSSLGLGIQGMIGIECTVTERISLLAEFNLNGTYSWDHWKNSSESQPVVLSRTESTNDGNSWNYGLNNLKIGIAYNF